MNYKKLIIIPLTLVSLSTFSLATIYSDGEDGTVGEWNVHDNKPSGATISNIMDESQNSRVIEFKGNKRRNSYMIGGKKGKRAWNNSEESKLRWNMNFDEKYKITLYLDTTKGRRVLFYNYKNHDKGLYKRKYIKIGLGNQTSQDQWVKIDRDLKADLKRYDPNNTLLKVNGFKVQGSGKIDNLELYKGDTSAHLEISDIHADKQSDTHIKIYWTLNKKATGQVEYGTSTEYGQFSKKEESFRYDAHRQNLRGLEPNTTYHYRVISEDKAGNKVLSGDNTFFTGNNETPCITRDKLKYKIAHNEDVTQVNTSCIKDMSQLFTNQEDFNQDISHWDVSNVTNMNSMFWNAHSFNQNLSNWNVSNVKDMGAMFAHAVAFNQNIGKWNVSNVKNMSSMFWGKDVCLDFNQDITHWNVSNVTNMELMFFQNCYNGYNFKNYDLSNWNVKNVTKHNLFFSGETHNNTEPNWEEIVPPYSKDAFVATWEIGAKKTLQLSGFNDGGFTPYKFNFHVNWGDGTSDNVKWDAANDNDGNDEAITHNYDKEGIYSVAITGTYPIPQGLCFEDIDEEGTLVGYQKLTAIEQWGTQKWKSMRRVFWECKDFNTINDPKAPDLSEVTNMSMIFNSASKFNQPVGHWDVSHITNMDNMFEGASAFNQDLSTWDIRKINRCAPDLRGTSFSTENYDKALKAWSKLDVKVHVMWLLDAKFSATASVARAILDESWNIRDGGELPQ